MVKVMPNAGICVVRLVGAEDVLLVSVQDDGFEIPMIEMHHAYEMLLFSGGVMAVKREG